jgi:hypothetical protein
MSLASILWRRLRLWLARRIMALADGIVASVETSGRHP